MVACEVLSSPSGHRADDIIHKITEVFNQVDSRYPRSSTPLWKWSIFFLQSYVSLYVSPNFNGRFSFYFSVCMWRSECTCLCYDLKGTSKNGHTRTCPKVPSFLTGTSC